MPEATPELPEVPLEELRGAIMEHMEWTEADLREQMEEARDQALFTNGSTVTEADGTPVAPEDLSTEEAERAVLNLLYHQYLVELGGADPLGLAE